MHPVLFELSFLEWFGLPAFKLHTYGLMIAIAFLVGMQLGAREARSIDVDEPQTLEKFFLDLSMRILLSAMVGARIVFILVEWDESYTQDPLKMFRVWEGGFVFYGGLIGAVLYSVYYARKHGRDFFMVADLCIPLVALGQFFGRLGCFAAGCCWGRVVDADHPLAVQFPAGSLAFGNMRSEGLLDATAEHTLHVHPVQLYESAGTLSIFVLLVLLRQHKRFHGQLLVTYMLLYAVLRGVVETFRGDALRGVGDFLGFPISTSQGISVAIFAAGLSILAFRLRARSKAPAIPEAATQS